MAAWQWSAGPEEWWAGWAGTAGIIPPPRGEEGFRSESARDPGGCAPGCPQRQEWWGELPEKSSGVLREGGCRSDSRGRRPYHRQEHSCPACTDVPVGRSTRGSGYHEPAGRVSAATTRRRRLTLFIRTEPGASDGTLRVPAHHRGPAAAGARARGPRGGAHPPVRSQGPPGRAAPPKGPGATASGRRAPGLAPRPGQAGLPPPTGPGEQVGGRHPPVSAPGEGPDLPGDRCRLLHQESSRVRDWGDSMRHRVRYARRSIWRPAGARRGGGRRSTPPQAAAPRSTSAQLARHLKGYDTRPSVGRTGVRWDSAWAEVGGYDPQGTRGSIRWCIPQEARPSGILPPRSSWNTRSETTPPRPGAQDAGRGRTRFCKQ